MQSLKLALVGVLSLSGAALVGLSATPALAGKLVDAAPGAMKGYAQQAGYVLASIPKCGGDAEEESYFRDLARDNLVQIGADEDDLGFLDFHMMEAAESAKPRKKDCSEDGSVPLASELFRLRAEIREALAAQ
jgi:hypothetical protein